jgi:transposase
MGKPLDITRTEHSAEDLRAFASKGRDGAQVRRLLALAFIMEGASRTEAAERSGMDRQTLRDWCIATTRRGSRGCDQAMAPESPPL